MMMTSARESDPALPDPTWADPTGEPADDRLDRIFHALAHRVRRALLARLAEGPAMVTELAAPFAMSLPSVSKHLKVLEAAGLIRRAVDGRVHTCAFDAAPLRDAGRWVDHYRAFWDDALSAVARHVETEQEDDAT